MHKEGSLCGVDRSGDYQIVLIIILWEFKWKTLKLKLTPVWRYAGLLWT